MRKTKQAGSKNKSPESLETHYLCQWLKRCRQDKGLTMRKVGDIIGQSHSFIGKIENKERRLDVSEYINYCQALGLDPQEGLKYVLGMVAEHK